MSRTKKEETTTTAGSDEHLYAGGKVRIAIYTHPDIKAILKQQADKDRRALANFLELKLIDIATEYWSEHRDEFPGIDI